MSVSRHTHPAHTSALPGQCRACDLNPTPTGPLEQESLPPAQYLMLEALAARHRLGEPHWTFPAAHAPIARDLQDRGLVWFQSGVAERTISVILTAAGRTCCLSPRYTPPHASH